MEYVPAVISISTIRIRSTSSRFGPYRFLLGSWEKMQR